jgi:hypothetical protein
MEWLFLGTVVLAIWLVRTAWKTRSAARVGFSPLNPFEGKQQDWYSGVVYGRRVAIRMVVLRNPYPGAFRKTKPYLQVVMDVVMRQPLDTLAVRHHHDTSSLHRFEEAFRVELGDLLSPDARKALLDFVRLGYPERARKRRQVPGPNARNLRLAKRTALPQDLLPANVMPDSRMVLIHDHPRLHPNADQFGLLLQEMAQVAGAVEDARLETAPTVLS